MGSCVRGIKGNSVEIGDLEAFVGDMATDNNYKIKKQEYNHKKIAIIGGGPAGITAAAFLAKNGNIEEHMMYNTFNMGIGMVLAVDPADADAVIKALETTGDKACVIGETVSGDEGVILY